VYILKGIPGLSSFVTSVEAQKLSTLFLFFGQEVGQGESFKLSMCIKAFSFMGNHPSVVKPFPSIAECIVLTKLFYFEI
jgi:hypothetical protein